MFEYLEMHMWNNGTEHCSAYESFALDEREICYGTSYKLENNHIKNIWKIEKWNNHTYVGIIAKGKEGTLCLEEFKQWLEKNEVPDAYMEWLRKNPEYVKRYPKTSGVKFI